MQMFSFFNYFRIDSEFNIIVNLYNSIAKYFMFLVTGYVVMTRKIIKYGSHLALISGNDR